LQRSDGVYPVPDWNREFVFHHSEMQRQSGNSLVVSSSEEKDLFPFYTYFYTNRNGTNKKKKKKGFSKLEDCPICGKKIESHRLLAHVRHVHTNYHYRLLNLNIKRLKAKQRWRTKNFNKDIYEIKYKEIKDSANLKAQQILSEIRAKNKIQAKMKTGVKTFKHNVVANSESPSLHKQYVCIRCGRKYTLQECKTNRFCVNCGTFLLPINCVP